jgi:hypothetical protein
MRRSSLGRGEFPSQAVDAPESILGRLAAPLLEYPSTLTWAI